MQFTHIPTEQTTAVTDLALAAVAAICLFALRRHRNVDGWKVGVWSWVLGLLCFAAGLGAVVHGLMWSESVSALLWQPLFLALGLAVGLFVVGAVYDWKGHAGARRALPLMLTIGVAFFLLTRVVSGTFLVFVLYEAVAMVFALGVYVALAVRGRMPGAVAVAAGIVLNVVAAGIQASGAVSLTVVVPFDHNGVFHLVQMVAVGTLVRGLLVSLRH